MRGIILGNATSLLLWEEVSLLPLGASRSCISSPFLSPPSPQRLPGGEPDPIVRCLKADAAAVPVSSALGVSVS